MSADKQRQEREEEFIAWRDHPMTKQVMSVFRDLGEQCKEKWIKQSWGGGKADPLMLADLRARYEAVEDMTELTFEELERAVEESERD
jgi:hypothetical protein